MRLLFGTSNPNKLKEAKLLLEPQYTILSMKDVKVHKKLEETKATIEGNAIQKVEQLHEITQLDCFAEDSGLCVNVLDGAPGVYSARYAGAHGNADNNMAKLLQELSSFENRSAYFLSVIALMLEGKLHVFEGRIDGRIITDKRGDGGFGYDPIFVPDGYTKTFAELSIDTKNKISHRAKSVEKLVAFLKS